MQYTGQYTSCATGPCRGGHRRWQGRVLMVQATAPQADSGSVRCRQPAIEHSMADYGHRQIDFLPAVLASRCRHCPAALPVNPSSGRQRLLQLQQQKLLLRLRRWWCLRPARRLKSSWRACTPPRILRRVRAGTWLRSHAWCALCLRRQQPRATAFCATACSRLVSTPCELDLGWNETPSAMITETKLRRASTCHNTW
jgi:hypothetical protein